MITIALDEAGVFEANIPVPEGASLTTLIGGVLFDDASFKDEALTERKRVISYYKKVVETVSVAKPDLLVKFPTDLHYRNTARRKQHIQVKKEIGSTLSEFLTSGTYNGETLVYDGKELPDRRGISFRMKFDKRY